MKRSALIVLKQASATTADIPPVAAQSQFLSRAFTTDWGYWGIAQIDGSGYCTAHTRLHHK
eukprot:scaffold5571_cov78-Skeletonema_dohrnii-CCMP3373.AAC.6